MVLYNNWWDTSSNNTQDLWFTRFFDSACKQYGISSDCISFWSVFGYWNDLEKQKQKQPNNVHIWFCGENLMSQGIPWNHSLQQNWFKPLELSQAMDVYLDFNNGNCPEIENITNYLYFPLWLMYWDFWKDGLFVPTTSSDSDRMPKAVLIAKHDATGFRSKLAWLVKQQFNLTTDSNNSHISYTEPYVHLGSSAEDKLKVLHQYQYCVCPENSIAPGYVTEKLFQSLCAGCTPIYMGSGTDQTELDVINKDCLITFDHATQRLIPSNLKSVKSPSDCWNDGAYQKIMVQYARLWISVRKLLLEKGLISRPLDTVSKVEYHVNSWIHAIETLYGHWEHYHHLFEPRAVFIDTSLGIQYEWESLIEVLTD